MSGISVYVFWARGGVRKLSEFHGGWETYCPDLSANVNKAIFLCWLYMWSVIRGLSLLELTSVKPCRVWFAKVPTLSLSRARLLTLQALPRSCVWRWVYLVFVRGGGRWGGTRVCHAWGGDVLSISCLDAIIWQTKCKSVQKPWNIQTHAVLHRSKVWKWSGKYNGNVSVFVIIGT